MNYTDIVVVLDRSGSMASVVNDTVGGFNSFVEEQKKQEGNARLTLVQFDTQYEMVHNGLDIQKVPSLEFSPRGGTALLDAIGRAINDTGARLRSLPEKERPDKVIFVIITDGEENSSREFGHARIRDMIKHQSDKYSWEFVFLGANQDSFAVGGNIGITIGNILNYTNDSRGVNHVYSSVSKGITRHRSGGAVRGNFFDPNVK